MIGDRQRTRVRFCDFCFGRVKFVCFLGSGLVSSFCANTNVIFVSQISLKQFLISTFNDVPVNFHHWKDSNISRHTQWRISPSYRICFLCILAACVRHKVPILILVFHDAWLSFNSDRQKGAKFILCPVMNCSLARNHVIRCICI